MNKFFSFFLVCCVFLSSSIKADVYYEYEEYDSRVKITTDKRGENGEILVTFEHCQDVKGKRKFCRTLGPRDAYSLEELQDRRFSEFLEVTYASGALLGLLASSVVLPGIMLVAYGLPALVPIPYYIGGIATVRFLRHDFLNPLEQYRQAETLSDPVLEGEDIELESSADIGDFVRRLDIVLSKISS